MSKRTSMLSSVIFIIPFFVLSLIKINFIIGSYHSFFSLGTIVSPLSGIVAGFWGTAGFLVLRWLMSGASLLFFVYNLPGFLAGLLWHAPVWVQVLVPSLCMAAFLLHPTGLIAYGYSLLWIIPICLAFSQHTFAKALQSSFTAHALGSVLWLYTTDLGAHIWWGLIPIVLYERLLIASGIWYGLYVYRLISRYSITQKILSLNAPEGSCA